MGLSVGETDAVGLGVEPYESLLSDPPSGSVQVRYGYFILGNSNDSIISFAVVEIDEEFSDPYLLLYCRFE